MPPLSWANCARLFAIACLVLVAEAVVSFPFFFAPGWANGWPGGLTIYQIWSTWLTITLFFMVMTAGIGVGALISLLACTFSLGRRHSGDVLGVWMIIWTALSLAASFWAFTAIYASTLEMWPNGYPG
jgi:hypothetical protein